MELIGAGDDPRFRTFDGREAHRAEVDELVGKWIGQRTTDEVMRAFEEAHAAVAPVLTMAQISEAAPLAPTPLSGDNPLPPSECAVGSR